MHYGSGFSRRSALQLALAGVLGRLSPAFAGGTLNFADIGVGDPMATGHATQQRAAITSISCRSAMRHRRILNVLVAGGGTGTYDIINIVGGMQKPLVDNDLIDELDISRLPSWTKDKNIGEFLAAGIARLQLYRLQRTRSTACPTVLQGDSFAYLPEKTGALDSYAALFDPKFKGYVALEDNYTTAGQKTALYMKHPAWPTSTIPTT